MIDSGLKPARSRAKNEKSMGTFATNLKPSDGYPNQITMWYLLTVLPIWLSVLLIWGAPLAHARDGELASTSQGSSEIAVEIPPRFSFEAIPLRSGARFDPAFCIRTNGLQRGYQISRSVTDLSGVTKLASPSLTGQASHGGFSTDCLRNKNIIEWRRTVARGDISTDVSGMPSVAMVLTPQL